MNSIIKTITTVSSLFLILTTAQAEALKIKIGTSEDNPPLSYIDKDGKLTGFEIELSEAICKEIKADCEFSKFSHSELFDALKDKKVDVAINNFSITEARLKVANATLPYMKTGGSRFLKLKSNHLELDVGHLEKQVIGVVSKTTGENYLTNNYKDLDLRRFVSTDDVMKALMSKEIDVVFTDETLLNFSYVQKPDSQVEFIGPVANNPKWFGNGKGIIFRKEDTKLLEEFNDAIKTLRARRDFQKISHKYFGKDIFK